MNTNGPEDDEMANEYDFSQGERGRLGKRLGRGYDIVIDGNEDQPIHVTAEGSRALAEDADDLAAFRDRAAEPTRAFEDFVADLKRRGRR
jgi:hypothetical protein